MANTSDSLVIDEANKKDQNPPVTRGRKEKSRDVVTTLEARLAKCEIFMGDGKDKFDELDQSIEELQSGGDELRGDMLGALNELASALRVEFASFKDFLTSEVAAIKEEVAGMKDDWALCKKTVAQGSVTTHVAAKVDVLKPKSYGGARNARELDNFLWGLDQYFDAAGIVEEERKIKTVHLYFTDATMIWWRRKCGDIECGTCTIVT